VSYVHVEILFFPSCSNYRATRDLVGRVAAELAIPFEVELVEVSDAEAAETLRFLGSPSVRVAGRDVEPGADQRTDFAFACRMYRSPSGVRSAPDEEWLRDAFRDVV
jgi:hypothetical protein